MLVRIFMIIKKTTADSAHELTYLTNIIQVISFAPLKVKYNLVCSNHVMVKFWTNLCIHSMHSINLVSF